VLYVGQISIRKGLRYLLQAFAKLKHPRKELWIVGPRTQLTGIDDLEIPDGTSFPGPLKGADLSRAYQQASVFVLPTLEDGFGLVLGEALSFGRPVITTVNSGGAELIQEGIEGFSVPIRDTASILEKLQLLAGNPGLLERMSSAALVRGRLIGGWSTAEKLLLDGLSKISKHSST
jgi:glycosyltransferase involved in cell wall biosynthesis